MLYKQPWFWILIVGLIVALAGLLLLILTSTNQTLWILVLVFGVLLAIGGGIYGLVRKKPATALALEEEDLKTRKAFTTALGKGVRNFNTGVEGELNEYIDNRFEKRFRDFSESAGNTAGSVGAAYIRSSVNLW